ncbi:hypothetical protein CANARDRAFT_8777 [[Candida] arabinofermentans NRRL YB-2248]|uniref:Serine/threonine-protein kinase ATG1 n=1 Tax=[Candida] arabinofermentans NRRL YB-2248 TaxID=983967 RepID=A0A1E4SY64_9ASCO|nr:hypothetical protein CANARDRAFT_8777 [[Candida] arabinofermentans NRRL YB-2248]
MSRSQLQAEQQSQQQVIGNFVIGPEIGRGSFANVYKGYDTSTKSPVAVKSVFRSRLKNQKLVENLEIEISILKNLKNPHIVALLDCVKTDQHFHLFMEYCALGDLSYFIRRRDQLVKTHPLISSILERYPSPPKSNGLNKVLVINFLKQLSSSLEFLRSQNLVHRDIKPQNLLLSPPVHSREEFKERGYSGLWELPVLKIADFGFARFLPSTSMAETLCGSPLYMAPEILRYEKYNAKADLWSVGAVIYEMAVGKPPFRASNHVELLRKIEKAKDEISFPTSAQVSDDVVRLICGLLKANPTERMGFQEFFSDPLITNDLECADEPLECSNVDEQLFISEYLPNPRLKTEAIQNPETITEDVEDEATQLANSPVTRINNAARLNRTPTDSLLIEKSSGTTTPSQRVRIPKPMEGSGNDDVIKKLITKSSPDPDALEHTINLPIGTSSRNPRLGGSKKDKDDIVFEKDYVVVEKRTVEVNALADELAKAGSGVGAINSSNGTTATPVHPGITGALRSGSPGVVGASTRRYSSSSTRSSSNASSHRRPSFGERKIPISISPTNALTKALGYTSNRLFGNQQQQQQQQQQLQYLGSNSSTPTQSNFNIDSAVSHMNANLLSVKTAKPLETCHEVSYEDSEVITELELLATMAHAISLFAEVKFSQLIPLPPSSSSDTGGVLTNSRDDEISQIDSLPPKMVKTIAAEGVALYLKTLSLLAKAMSIASEWWHSNFSKSATSPKLNELVQWIRSRFNESLEKAEFLRLRLAEANDQLSSSVDSSSKGSLNEKPVIAEKLIFERALEMSRTAALNELKNEDLLGCELSYSTSIWMLETLMNGDGDSVYGSSGDASGSDKLDVEDRKTVELFINSIGNRLKVLRQKIEKQGIR